jgi:hypothetical protein
VTQHDPRLYLTHTVDSIELVESYVDGLDLPAFAVDQEKQDAVVLDGQPFETRTRALILTLGHLAGGRRSRRSCGRTRRVRSTTKRYA